MQTLFIFGSEGVIGSHLAAQLSKNFIIHCFDLRLGHDLTNHEEVESIFSSTRCDAVLNLFALNEHVGRSSLALSYDDFQLSDITKYMQVNIVALFDVCRTFIKYNKSGVVLNYSSIYGLGVPDNRLYDGGSMKHIGYSVSKSAVIPLTQYFAKNSDPSFRFNCIAPGGVFAEQPETFVAKYSDRTPLRRMCHVDDLVGPTIFLLSPQSSYVNGAVLPVDGGFSIR